MSDAERKLGTAWWVLRAGLGVGVFAAGLDKFFNLLTTWSMYLSPFAERLLPVSAGVFMRAVGVGEMLIGLAILTRWTRAGAWAMAAWLAAIAVNLALAGSFWDLAVRDLEVAIASFVLARLTEWRGEAARALAPAGRDQAGLEARRAQA